MTGKDLFEGMSWVDERFVDEAEHAAFPKPRVIPWIKIASMAACLCLILFGLHSFRPYHDEENADGQNVEDVLPPGGVSEMPAYGTNQFELLTPGDDPSREVPSVILHVEEMTETGFTGTVARLVDTDIFAIGTELNVMVADGTRHENTDRNPAISADYAGHYVMVQFIEYDLDAGTIVVDLIQEVPKEG